MGNVCAAHGFDSHLTQGRGASTSGAALFASLNISRGGLVCHMIEKKNKLIEATEVKLRIQHKFRSSHACFIVVLNV